MICGLWLAAGGGAPVTRDGARADARHELAKAVYHRYDDPWPVRAFRAVEHWLSRLLDQVAGHAPGGGPGAIGLVALVVALVAVARWRFGPVRRGARAPGAVLEVTPSRAADHRRRATDAADRGDWRTAVVERMRALARGLEEQDLVAAGPGRTAVELAAEVGRIRPPAAPAVAAAAVVFDAVAYGGRNADAHSYETVLAADRAVAAPSARLVGPRR